MYYVTLSAPVEPETSFKTEGKPQKARLYVQSVITARTQPALKIAGLVSESPSSSVPHRMTKQVIFFTVALYQFSLEAEVLFCLKIE